MHARAGIDIDGQRIAADDAAGRMNDDVLAHRATLRIKRLLHDQRSLVDARGKHRALAIAPVAKIELCTPSARQHAGIE